MQPETGDTGQRLVFRHQLTRFTFVDEVVGVEGNGGCLSVFDFIERHRRLEQPAHVKGVQAEAVVLDVCETGPVGIVSNEAVGIIVEIGQIAADILERLVRLGAFARISSVRRSKLKGLAAVTAAASSARAADGEIMGTMAVAALAAMNNRRVINIVYWVPIPT